MKVGGIIGLIMLISIIFLAGSILIDDFEKNYVETNISSVSPINQSLKESLVNQSQINETFDPLQRKFEDLKSQEGFFDAVSDGTIVLPLIFIDFVVSILKIVGLTQQQAFALLKFLGIPILIITFIGIGIIVWFVLKGIEQLRRYPA